MEYPAKGKGVLGKTSIRMLLDKLYMTKLSTFLCIDSHIHSLCFIQLTQNLKYIHKLLWMHSSFVHVSIGPVYRIGQLTNETHVFLRYSLEGTTCMVV